MEVFPPSGTKVTIVDKVGGKENNKREEKKRREKKEWRA